MDSERLKQLKKLDSEVLASKFIDLLDAQSVEDLDYFLDVLRACIDKSCLEKSPAALALRKLERVKYEVSTQIKILNRLKMLKILNRLRIHC
jgi:hypothetical protein